MLVIAAYLSAMAGITVLCYAFRKHHPNGVGEDVCLRNSEALNNVATSPSTDESKATEQNSLNPETETKIQEVMSCVDTPNDVLEPSLSKGDEQQSEEKLELPDHNSSGRKKPKEVIDDIKQSQAKVEAWISELGKVINSDGVDTNEKQGSRSRGSSPTVKPKVLSAEARKKSNDERLTKVKEEMAKRRGLMNSRVESTRRRELEKEEERNVARKRWAAPTENREGLANKREAVETAKKRSHDESAATGGCVKAKRSVSQMHKSTTNNVDEKAGMKKTAVTKDENAMKASSSRSRGQVGRIPISHRSEGQAEEKDDVAKTSTRTDVKGRGTTKPPFTNYTRTRCVGPTTRSTLDAKTRPQISSKIPLMVNSRTRPPVFRQAEKETQGPKVDEKPIPPVIQKPVKTLRITSMPPPLPPARCPDYVVAAPTPMAERVSSHLNTRHQDGAANQSASYERGQQQETSRPMEHPEVKIIDVRETHSYGPDDVQAEKEYAADVCTRVAKSGPIRFDNALDGTRSQSIVNLQTMGSTLGRQVVPPGTLLNGQSMSVSKTVELPDTTDNNVTVYFSVTVPRHGTPNINRKGHDDSDHTITLSGVRHGSISEFQVHAVREKESVHDVDYTAVENDDDDHSDDGVFPDDISSYVHFTDAEQDVSCYDSSIGGEFDSCDEQF